jgi:arginine decarboxylase
MHHNTEIDKNLYNITRWSDGYFGINDQGKVEIRKNGEQYGVELQAIVQAASNAGLQLPLLIRCTDILHDRVKRLYAAFTEAIAQMNYQGTYQLVYPIKVNQEYCVVRELLNTPQHTIGLEAGSKPELMAVIGLLDKKPSTIVCNGYKDSSYIRTALIAQEMGHQVLIIIEKHSELSIILREAKRLNLRPKLGVRLRLNTVCAGKWQNTTGSHSKFGLNTRQVLHLVQELKHHQFLDCLHIIHCHFGSQIANIDDIAQGIQEISRYYLELRQLGVPINTIDVGGGLGVDYAGTCSSRDGSINYSLKDYAQQILFGLQAACQEAQVPEPHIISESGRALTAHHAFLITNIIDTDGFIQPTMDVSTLDADLSPAAIYQDAERALQEAHALFKQAKLSLSEKAQHEDHFLNLCAEILQKLPENDPLRADLQERLASKIFCNLSFFQSIPDAWAIAQLFPVMPISQLTSTPSMHCILQDLTCDSDGTLKQYPGRKGISSTLLLPPFDAEKPYHLAFFLVGAYQEILGNLHNLFGDTNSLNIKILGESRFEINDLVRGDTVSHVLHFAHLDSQELLQSYKQQLHKNSHLTPETIDIYLDDLLHIFTQLTYLEAPKELSA